MASSLADTQMELEQRLLRQLFMLGPSTLLSAAVAALTITAVFFWRTSRWQALAWGALILAMLALRLGLMRANARRYPEPAHALRQPGGAWRYLAPLGPYAACWGLGPWLLLPQGQANLELSLVLILGMFSVLAGSVPIIAGSRAVIVLWLAPFAVGMAARFAVQGGTLGWFAAGCALIFSAAMGRFAWAQHTLLRRGLGAQLEKEALSEQLMAQSRDLQRLSQERSRFFASASHDLRQPVHALALFSEALRRDLHGHAALPVAERVVDATRQVSHLLSAMLDISKIDAGAVRPVFARVAVDEVFLRLAQIYEQPAAAKGLALRFHLAPRVVVTDGELLLRILSNFIDNAIKYSDRGGVLVSARMRGEHLRLAVWDTGRGIGDEHLPRLFDEFYQVDNAHRDTAQGLGIGLAIVQRLAALIDGRVGLRSVPGRGSVFWVDLPPKSAPAGSLEAAPPVVTAAASVEAAGAVRPALLLLDDEVAVCEAMRIWLQPHCAAIHIAHTVAAALDVVARHGAGIDAFVVDFRLAGPVNGIEATHLLRAAASRTVPAVLVTGDTDPARVRAAYDSGLVVLFKPVGPVQLIDTLRGLAARP